MFSSVTVGITPSHEPFKDQLFTHHTSDFDMNKVENVCFFFRSTLCYDEQIGQLNIQQSPQVFFFVQVRIKLKHLTTPIQKSTFAACKFTGRSVPPSTPKF